MYKTSRFAYEVSTAPALEPITSTEAKNFIKVDTTADDTLIGVLITAARQLAEEYTERAFVEQTVKLYLDSFPSACKTEPWWDGIVEGPMSLITGTSNQIELPKPPLISVTSLKYYSKLDVVSTLSSSTYFVDTKGTPGRICLNYGQIWPTDIRTHQAVLVEFKAGYGATAASVPAQIRQAISMIVGNLYAHRGDSGTASESEIPALAKNLLDPYRVRRFG